MQCSAFQTSKQKSTILIPISNFTHSKLYCQNKNKNCSDMPKDCLAAFRQKAGITESDDEEQCRALPPERMDSVDSTTPLLSATWHALPSETSKHEKELDHFFCQVADLKTLIEDLKGDVEKVKNLHEKILSTPVANERDKVELDELIFAIETISQVIRTKLKDMKKSNDKAEKHDISESVLVRIRKTQYSASLKNFMDAINKYQYAQTEYRDKCKSRIQRRLEIMGSKFSDDDVEKMLEQGNMYVFTQGIIMETEQDSKKILADVVARHNDIVKLEQSLTQLHELFMEMAYLVETQGDVLDSIQASVTCTQDHVTKAHEELRHAHVFHTETRQKKVLLIIVVVVFVSLLLGGTVYYFLR